MEKWCVHYGINTRNGFYSFGFVEVEAENQIAAMADASEMHPNAPAIKWLADKNIPTTAPKIGYFDCVAVRP